MNCEWELIQKINEWTQVWSLSFLIGSQGDPLEISQFPYTQELSGHCNVMLNSTSFMLTGGADVNRYRSETLIYDFISQEWTTGPKMIHKRREHGCVKLENIIWVTGGWTEDGYLNSTEFLDLDNLNEGWKEGSDLPYSVTYHRMAASEDMKTAYITGGYGSEKWSEDILELKCTGFSPSSCAFKFSEANIKIKRAGHVALPISNELAEELCS